MSPSSASNLKAVAKDYLPRPFHFAQTSPAGAIRRVAWTSDLSQLKSLAYAVLEQFSPDAYVLLKVDKQNVPDGAVWTRYHGEAPLAGVIQAIKDNERMIFQDGYTQLCVRDADSGDYIALDEYDLLWIYSNDPKFADICGNFGFEDRPEQLISQRPHWRCSLDDSPQLRDRFVSALILELVD